MNANGSLPGAASGLPTMPQYDSSLPVGHLESLRSKINQMIDSIQALQWTVEAGGQSAMPAWPDILSKYTMLLSQSHNLSMSLVGTFGALSAARTNGAGSSHTPSNPYERLALHPSVPMTDAQLDNEVMPLLRNQQTTDVLNLENETVRHLAQRMASRGSLGVPTTASQRAPGALASRPSDIETERVAHWAKVMAECEQIKVEHDERIERAVNAVIRLRSEKYDWKLRVEVEQEEPEELEWDPRLGDQATRGGMREQEEESNDSEEEEELEEVLGREGDQSPEGTPEATSPMHVD
ncbi:hypothetical protein BDW22DRAFT_1361727 [Trametopsis cervina]|nr:hypothetical protein BDW22DRAFT_1361727 [Trametopsis cervina]